nr:hypothetical protein [Tanacetum cinerariifolium]
TSSDSSLDDLSDSSASHSSSGHSSAALPSETGSRVDVVVRGNDEPHSEHDIDLEGADMSERIRDLERDNTRLRGTLGVVSQRVTRLQCRELRV